MQIDIVQIAPVPPRKPRVDVSLLPEFAQRLREARIGRGFSDAKSAATRFGFNHNSYASHESGTRMPKGPTVQLYAKKFGVSAGWLLTGIVDKGASVPVVGIAGAGPDGSILFNLGDGNLGDAPSPPVRSRAQLP